MPVFSRKRRFSAAPKTLDLCAEPLESRRLLAGNVTANVVDGSLVISGDGRANEIAINIDVNRHVTIVGQNSTTVSGNYAASPFTEYGINIRLKGGADKLQLTNQATGRFKIFIDSGGGTDEIDLDLAEAEYLTIRAGGAADTIEFFSNNVATVELIDIRAGGGDDTVRMGMLHTQWVAVRGDGGHDLLEIFDTDAVGNVAMMGGGGHDQVFFLESSAERLHVDTGGGHDTSAVTSALDQLYIVTGGGNDAIQLGLTVPDRPVTVAHSSAIVTGGGADKLSIQNAQLSVGGNRTEIHMGAGHDELNVADSTLGELAHISTGSGNDTATVQQSTIDNGLISLEGGKDQLSFGGVCGTVQATGGSASDQLFLGLQCVGATFTYSQFEEVLGP